MPRYAKLKSLVELPKGSRKATATQINQAASRLAALLKKERASGSFRVGMLDRGKEVTMSFDYGGGRCKVTRGTTGRPNFAIRASRETLTEMAAGRQSPVDAYLTGKLEVHGDLDYGKRVYARAAAAGGKRDF